MLEICSASAVYPTPSVVPCSITDPLEMLSTEEISLAYEIYKTVNYLLKKPELINEQLKQVNKTIKELRSNTSSSNEASNVLLSYLR